MIYDKTAEQDRKVVEAVGAVATARRKRNGELLRLAEREFDVFLPVDRKLRHQQNLPRFSRDHRDGHAHQHTLGPAPLIAEVLRVLPAAKPGQALIVGE